MSVLEKLPAKLGRGMFLVSLSFLFDLIDKLTELFGAGLGAFVGHAGWWQRYFSCRRQCYWA